MADEQEKMLLAPAGSRGILRRQVVLETEKRDDMPLQSGARRLRTALDSAALRTVRPVLDDRPVQITNRIRTLTTAPLLPIFIQQMNGSPPFSGSLNDFCTLSVVVGKQMQAPWLCSQVRTSTYAQIWKHAYGGPRE